MNRLICLLRGHPAGQWSALQNAGRATFYRTRFCPRCKTELVKRNC